MTLSDMLDTMAESTPVYIGYCDGVRGAAGDLVACLCDEMLDENVEYIEHDHDCIRIYLE